MAPETAVVVSAAISAVVAVSSVGISALREASADRRRIEREGQQRSEDRAWSLRLHNHQERQRLYRELLAAASEVSLALVLMETSTRLNERRRVNEAVAQFAETAAAVDVASYDRDVLDLTLSFRQTSGRAMAAIVFRDPEPDELLKRDQPVGTWSARRLPS